MTASNTWINRTDIKSESSNRVYVVSQHATKRHWACSCPGWKAHRRCKHLTQLGLPADEQPFEVTKDYAMKKGFLDEYKTYDASTGHGLRAEWQQQFAARLGLAEARAALGLAADADWDAVRQAFHLAAAESKARLIADYERAAVAFDGHEAVEATAEAVKTAKFRLEAYVAYLDEQRQQLESASERITGGLLARLRDT